MKAYRGVDGKIRLFRPELNAARLNRSAARLSLPTFEQDEFVKLLTHLVAKDSRWVMTPSPPLFFVRLTARLFRDIRVNIYCCTTSLRHTPTADEQPLLLHRIHPSHAQLTSLPLSSSCPVTGAGGPGILAVPAAGPDCHTAYARCCTHLHGQAVHHPKVHAGSACLRPALKFQPCPLVLFVRCFSPTYHGKSR